MPSYMLTTEILFVPKPTWTIKTDSDDLIRSYACQGSLKKLSLFFSFSHWRWMYKAVVTNPMYRKS